MTTDAIDRLVDHFDGRIEAHETLDQARFDILGHRLERIERIIIASAATLILGMAGVIGTLLWRLPLGTPGVHP